jgi:hypothetical protein
MRGARCGLISVSKGMVFCRAFQDDLPAVKEINASFVKTFVWRCYVTAATIVARHLTPVFPLLYTPPDPFHGTA